MKRHLRLAAAILSIFGATLVSGCSSIHYGTGDDIKLNAAAPAGATSYAKLTEADLTNRSIAFEGKYGREQYTFGPAGSVYIQRNGMQPLTGSWKVNSDGDYCVVQEKWFPNGQCWHAIVDQSGHLTAIERTTNTMGRMAASLYIAG